MCAILQQQGTTLVTSPLVPPVCPKPPMPKSPRTRLRRKWLAVASAFKCLSALAAIWIPSAQACAAAAEQEHLRGFVSALYEFSVSAVHTAITYAANPQTTDECHHLASCAAGALLATAQIAVNAAAADTAHIASLRASSASRALADACVAAAAPGDSVWARAPQSAVHALWVTLAEVTLTWTGYKRDAADADWEAAAQSMQHVCAPVVTAWSDLRARAAAHDFDWAGTAPALRRLCGFAATLLATAGPRARQSRRCMFAAVRPMVEAAAEVMAAAQHAHAHTAALQLSRLMVAAVQNGLKEMPEPLVERIMSVSATATVGARSSKPVSMTLSYHTHETGATLPGPLRLHACVLCCAVKLGCSLQLHALIDYVATLRRPATMLPQFV